MPARNGHILRDPDASEQWLRDGYLVVPLLTEAECRDLLDVYRSFFVDKVVSFTINSVDLEFRRQQHEALAGILREPILRLLNDYVPFGLNFVVKPPGGPELPLHQDDTLVDESQDVFVNIWCAAHDMTLENGCLTVTPQSHRWTRQIRAFGDGLERSPFRDVYDAIVRMARPVPMRAGQAFLYHSRTLHGSVPNRTDQPRIATLCGARPRELNATFHHRISRTEAERFHATDEFYWTESFVFVRPRRATSLGTIPIHEQRPFNEADLRSVKESVEKATSPQEVRSTVFAPAITAQEAWAAPAAAPTGSLQSPPERASPPRAD